MTFHPSTPVAFRATRATLYSVPSRSRRFASRCSFHEELRGEPERLVGVHWASSSTALFLVAIQAEALDRHRLLSDITKVLADEKVNILSASVTTSRDRVAVSRFSFEMGDPKHLGHVLRAVRNVEGVYDVYRVTSAS